MLLSPRVKFAAFTLLVGVALIVVLSFVSNSLLPAQAKYLVALAVIVLYAVIAIVLERYSGKERW